MPSRSIEEVMNAHTEELMSLKGVVGVYIGELDSGKKCVTVMTVEKDENLEKQIPKTLEGYPVVIQITGEIKPL